MTKKTAILSVTVIFLLAAALILLAKSSPAVPDPNAKHGAMELFGIGPEMFQDRGVAWVKALSGIVKEGISELGIIAAAIILFLQNAKTGRQIKDKIDETKQEMAQRFSAQGQRIHEVALAANPNGAPVQEIDRATVIAPKPAPEN